MIGPIDTEPKDPDSILGLCIALLREHPWMTLAEIKKALPNAHPKSVSAALSKGARGPYARIAITRPIGKRCRYALYQEKPLDPSHEDFD